MKDEQYNSDSLEDRCRKALASIRYMADYYNAWPYPSPPPAAVRATWDAREAYSRAADILEKALNGNSG